ncbi:hypothetical protein HZ326_2876 [Fusarium oxysporum f. sp. albedinis]|nr:hypothetical protein HZ326_2876 [Fusarium oxysporum f. sp. albedinis]
MSIGLNFDYDDLRYLMIYLSYNFTFTVFMICIGRYLTYTNLLQLAKIYLGCILRDPYEPGRPAYLI